MRSLRSMAIGDRRYGQRRDAVDTVGIGGSMDTTFKNILYGISSFADVSLDNAYYVDKTIYVPELEKIRFSFFIRPRRFGKSMLLSMLGLYYGLEFKDKFETLFKDTWILNNSTNERGKYLVLYLDFSAVPQAVDDLQVSFYEYCKLEIWAFMQNYKHYLSDEIIELVNNAHGPGEKLNALAHGIKNSGQKLYIFIDEYDNFTNSLLSNEGTIIYEQLTRQNGFFKDFFRTLKHLTSGTNSALSRLFMTGVSPITLDDVSSGFNIGTNISMMGNFNSLVGFTEQDVSDMFDYYISIGKLNLPKTETMNILRKWYDNYRFAYNSKEGVYNTDGVLYFLQLSIANQEVPRELIDYNLRMDYTKLQNLVYYDNKETVNGNFTILTEIINNDFTISDVKSSFSFSVIKQPQNYKSFLYFLGLLTHAGKEIHGESVLQIPNETIRHLVYEYIKVILQKPYGRIDWLGTMIKKLSNMAFLGDYKPAFEYIEHLLGQQSSIRDYVKGEDLVKMFNLVYLKVNDFYITYTEREANKGYADIILFPYIQRYPDMKYAYLIEVKYIKKEVKGKKLKTELEDKIADAQKKIEQYYEEMHEYGKIHFPTVEIKTIILVYHGWKIVHMS